MFVLPAIRVYFECVLYSVSVHIFTARKNMHKLRCSFCKINTFRFEWEIRVRFRVYRVTSK